MRLRIVLTMVCVLAAVAAVAVLRSGSDDPAGRPRRPVNEAQVGVDRIQHPTTVQGADTVLRFQLLLTTGQGARVKDGLLVCRGTTALSGSSGDVFSNPGQAHRACGNLAVLDPAAEVCDRGSLRAGAETGWAKVAGRLHGRPYTASFAEAGCESNRAVWRRVSVLWRFSDTVAVARLVIPQAQGQPPLRSFRQRWADATIVACEISMPVAALRPCLESVQRTNASALAPRGIELTPEQITELSGAPADVVRRILREAGSVPAPPDAAPVHRPSQPRASDAVPPPRLTAGSRARPQSAGRFTSERYRYPQPGTSRGPGPSVPIDPSKRGPVTGDGRPTSRTPAPDKPARPRNMPSVSDQDAFNEDAVREPPKVLHPPRGAPVESPRLHPAEPPNVPAGSRHRPSRTAPRRP